VQIALIFAAIATYTIVAGCSVRAGRAAAVAPIAGMPVREIEPAPPLVAEPPIFAVGIQVQRTDWIDRYVECIDEAADLGANAVKIVVDARQEDGQSNVMYLDHRRTPSPDDLGRLFRHAESRGLDVIFMPIVLVDDPKGDEWRGTLTPESWATWFESYRGILQHFLWVADGNGVDVVVIGSELLSSERQVEEWRKTIAFCRERFGGRLTYSANWDHYQDVPFWDELDLIGMNSYWRLGGEDASVEEIVGNWRRIQRELEPFVRSQGKPLLFLEVGWCSLENAASEPWDYTQPVPIDLELQARLWTGFWQAWHGTPWLGGMSVWEWPPGDGGPDDRGYTVENKPAEDVLRQWFAREPWVVQVGE
jgi:hypothetical protein